MFKTDHDDYLFLPLIKKSLLLLFGLLFAAYASSLAWSQEAIKPPAEEGLAADAALARLLSGNERFVSGKIAAKDYAHEREELTKSQHPYAVVLACSDSRVAPEIVFDESLGKLFIVRVAGHVADPVVLGSVEYAVEHLHAHLLIVLGHEGCGAVKATLGGGEELPPNIDALVRRILPVVEKTRSWKLGTDDLLSATVKENVRYQMQMALYQSEPLAQMVGEQKLKIVGGVYNLHTGRVELVSSGVMIEAPLTVAPAAVAEDAGHKPAKMLTNVVIQNVTPSAAPAVVVPEAKKVEEVRKFPASGTASLAELVKHAYEKRMDVVLQKSAQLRDDRDRCASFDCRNIPAGERVQVVNPMILKIGGKPQIRVRYKGALGYIGAEESDLGFVNRKN